MDKPFTVYQDVFKAESPPIQVVPVVESDPNATVRLAALLASLDGAPLGLAGAYEKCKLVCLALSSPTQVVLFRFAATPKSKGKAKKTKKVPAPQLTKGRIALSDILTSPSLLKLGVYVDRLSTSLFLDHNLLISSAVDIAYLGSIKSRKQGSADAIATALGGWGVLGDKDRVGRVFESEQFSAPSAPMHALRAWACGKGAFRVGTEKLLAQAPRYNTVDFDQEELAVLSQLKRDQDRLDALKPTKVKNDVAAEFSLKSGNLDLQQTRFKTRMRVSASQQIVVEYKATPPAASTPGSSSKNVQGGKPTKTQVSGRALRVDGKSAQVQIRGTIPSNGKIAGVYTLGKEDPTNAEAARAVIVRTSLVGQNGVLRGPMARAVWFPKRIADRAEAGEGKETEIKWSGRPLNASQVKAVRAILDDRLISVIHGGPGTGKTTVIAAAVMSLIASEKKSTVWLVAQSNVAVKNIAEKLTSCGFNQYRVMVSYDFHFDWHEHLYERIEPNVVRSDNLPSDIVATERVLGGARVVLCTLSTISNTRVMSSGLHRLVPVQTVIVDEASQIEVGDYLPLIARFATTLKKIACIGDDKQLPPYGQDDIPELRSVFEVPHLRHDEVFLDIQYRMPGPLGHFISKHVYGGRLKTSHLINSHNSVRFVDIPGVEVNQSHSWVNMKEVQAVTHIARVMQNAKKSFRIITAYDAQRSRIEDALKSASLKWEDKVFNVDSFQGNEDDYIIVSLVRTNKVGFLSNARRANVMLSRCRKGMVICANRAFLMGDTKAQKTLVGKLAMEWEGSGRPWVSWLDLLQGRM